MTDAARDVVVIGSGHNSLVAACYLARRGLDVEVVEQDTVIGGAVSTVERFPGHQVDRGSSLHVMIRHTGILEDLGLDQHGLTYVDLDPWGFAPVAGPTGERRGIHFHVDIDATCDSIARAVGDRDATAYHRFATDWRARNQEIFRAFHGPPTTRRLGSAFWRAGRGTGLTGGDLTQEFLTSADALLDATFEDERLKAPLAWLAAQAGPPPHETGTADLLGWNMMMHAMPPGRAVGGSGALTAALASKLRHEGGTIRLGDGVTGIVTDGSTGRAHGVVTASGARIGARCVVAGAHVTRTLGLLDHDHLPAGVAAALAAQTRRLRVGNGIGMAVRLATDDLPRYPGAGAGSWNGMQLLSPSRHLLRAAYADYLAGRPPQRPAVLAMTLTAVDPSTAPPGRHNITLWGQWHPYTLADGTTWKSHATRAADAMITEVEDVAPGFRGSIRDMYVQTPENIQSELSLPAANVMHLESTLDSMFALRPTPLLAQHRVPGVPGLYLTGASTHPGGGVFGASGRTVASLVGRDWRSLRRDRPTGRLPVPRRGGTASRSGAMQRESHS